MSITYYGIEWDYNNLADITYNSATLNEPYATWLYEKSRAVGSENDSLSVGYSSKESSVNRFNNENLLVTDDNINSVTKLYDENVNLSILDSYSEEVISNKKDSIIVLTSDWWRELDRDNSERLLKVTDTKRSFANNTLKELFSISDSYAEGVISSKKETINLDIYDDSNVIHITNPCKESQIYLLDEGRFIATDSQGEQTIGEQTEVGGGIVLFDFEINSTPLSESNFENWIEENSPINYNELRPFIPGEYEYKDAYVGFKLSIPPTEGRFGVYGSTVYIDVEDTVEKGFAEATSNGLTRVTFSKRFYTSPHIMSSLVYATENCYVEIPTVTKEYFEFGLKSISTGLYLNGEISWLADGY